MLYIQTALHIIHKNLNEKRKRGKDFYHLLPHPSSVKTIYVSWCIIDKIFTFKSKYTIIIHHAAYILSLYMAEVGKKGIEKKYKSDSI